MNSLDSLDSSDELPVNDSSLDDSLLDDESSLDLSFLRRATEQREEVWLDPRAAHALRSRGRAAPEAEDAVRTQWQRDRDRIIHCKAFRRLKHKTQVFVSPERDHYRTRLTHTLEVTQIARTVARALRLNEDLVEAIGMGHDLGHAPFGHVGEAALDAAYRRYDPDAHFRHYEQSLRIVDELENHGQGLNLTWETRDGILYHSKGEKDLDGTHVMPSTLEGQVVRICDRIAYVNHDIDDARRAGLIRAEELPSDCIKVLGKTHGERITTMVLAVVLASSSVRNGQRLAHETIAMKDDVRQATDALKTWMFSHVYTLESVDESSRVQTVINGLFDCFMARPHLMRPAAILPVNTSDSAPEIEVTDETLGDTKQLARRVCDYIAGMTDRFASQTHSKLCLPSNWCGH